MSLLKVLGCFFLMSSLLACGQLGSRSYRRKWKEDVPQYESGLTAHEFYLSDYPDWLDFNSSAQCFHQTRTKYLNLPKLKNTFALTYGQAILLQQLLNIELQKYIHKNNVTEVLLKDEQSLFYHSLEKIRSGLPIFRPPKFKRIHFIWIDPLLSGDNVAEKIRKVLARPLITQGYPILVTLCRSQKEIYSFVHENKLDEFNLMLLGQEMFSIYSENDEKKPYFMIYFNGLFKKTHDLHLFTPTGKVPIEFQGQFKVHSL